MKKKLPYPINDRCSICNSNIDVTFCSTDFPDGICNSCVKKEELVPCHKCGDMRLPENMVETLLPNYKGKKFCIGCLEELEDEMM